MGFFSDIKRGIKNLISDSPNQYVIGDNQLESELITAMNNPGEAKLSASEAALLAKASKEADRFAIEMDESQKKGIILHVSEMTISAKNGIEKWIKTMKMKKAKAIIHEDKSELPKDDTVAKAEATNGKIQTISAKEIENQPREKGGRDRDSRIK